MTTLSKLPNYKTDVPTGESGSETGIPIYGLLSWAAMGQMTGNDLEYAPELMWPNSVRTYQMMRNDSQCDGLLQGAMMPLTQWQWGIAPNGAPEVIVQELSRDLGLPRAELDELTGAWKIDNTFNIPRSQGRFDFQEHIREALLAVAYGYNYFEQVADFIEPPEGWPVDVPLRARLKKLAERPPWSITEINTAPDGGLLSIKQLQHAYGDPGIGVNELTAYVWGKEGANWVGRSMLRSSFRPWLVKDRVMRVGAINIERSGAGTPIITAPPGATKPQLDALNALAQRFRAGDSAGGAIPYGSQMALMGIMGSQPDARGFMDFLNEEMARGFLQMFQVLGQSAHGSRALGGTFLDFFEWALEAVANWFCAIFNKYVIEDWMQWNFPQDPDAPDLGQFEYAPRLVFSKKGDATEYLRQGVQDQSLQVDQNTQEQLNEPDKPAPTNASERQRRLRASRRARGGPSGTAGTRQERSVSGEAEGSPALPLPARPLRRQPLDFEVTAGMNLAQMDSDWELRRDSLVRDISAAQGRQIDQLHDAIVEAGNDLGALAEIQADPIHAAAIQAAMVEMTTAGMRQAQQEAANQGESIALPDVNDLVPRLTARATAIDQILANSLSQSARTNAIRLAQGTLDAAAVARDVRTHLQGLSDSYLRDQLGNAMTAAQNTGRGAVMDAGNPTRIYASEILDNATCALCIGIDGTQYETIADAEADYPGGGFKDCMGGGRCRGTLVAVYNEGQQVTVE
jgi:hypothetical protein